MENAIISFHLCLIFAPYFQADFIPVFANFSDYFLLDTTFFALLALSSLWTFSTNKGGFLAILSFNFFPACSPYLPVGFDPPLFSTNCHHFIATPICWINVCIGFCSLFSSRPNFQCFAQVSFFGSFASDLTNSGLYALSGCRRSSGTKRRPRSPPSGGNRFLVCFPPHFL